MANGLSQADAFENVDNDVTSTGFSHPRPAVRQGFMFGWGGSGNRSSTLITAMLIGGQVYEEVLTIAAAATTDTAANLLLANSIIYPISIRVQTTIPTAATFNVGDATTPARFKSGVSVTAIGAGLPGVAGMDHWSGVVSTLAAGTTQAAAAKIRITPNLTPASAAGVVALQVLNVTCFPATA